MDTWAIIGLGNPGKRFENTRHNIGFRVVDELAQRAGKVSFSPKPHCEAAKIQHSNRAVWLIKPTTYMNESGKALGFLIKQGVKPERIIVVHDELELPFGRVKIKFSGSARGHNGLRSIIGMIGKDFWRVVCGIDRPADRSQVAEYVLSPFTQPSDEIIQMIAEATSIVEAQLEADEDTSA